MLAFYAYHIVRYYSAYLVAVAVAVAVAPPGEALEAPGEAVEVAGEVVAAPGEVVVIPGVGEVAAGVVKGAVVTVEVPAPGSWSLAQAPRLIAKAAIKIIANIFFISSKFPPLYCLHRNELLILLVIQLNLYKFSTKKSAAALCMLQRKILTSKPAFAISYL